MRSKLKRDGQVRAENTPGRPSVSTDLLVDIGPALVRSHLTLLFGRPYPVQFRAQGAIDAWARAWIDSR